MRKMNDLTGKKFGKLTVIACAGKTRSGNFKWECICECETKTIVASCNLISGNTKGCGCNLVVARKINGANNIANGVMKKAADVDRFKGTKIAQINSTKLFKNNTSGHKGISWHKRRKKWETYITIQGKTKRLGAFEDKKEAIEAREVAEKLYFHPIIAEYEKLQRKIN